MIKLFRVIYFGVYLFGESYATILGNGNNTYANMSCDALMLHLIEESSFGKIFNDKKLKLVYGFERQDQYIGITFSHKKAGRKNNGVYANFELDLLNSTLMYIDPSPEIPVKINKDYVPYITSKCTPDENIYINTAALPDSEENK